MRGSHLATDRHRPGRERDVGQDRPCDGRKGLGQDHGVSSCVACCGGAHVLDSFPSSLGKGTEKLFADSGTQLSSESFHFLLQRAFLWRKHEEAVDNERVTSAFRESSQRIVGLAGTGSGKTILETIGSGHALRLESFKTNTHLFSARPVTAFLGHQIHACLVSRLTFAPSRCSGPCAGEVVFCTISSRCGPLPSSRQQRGRRC